MAEFDKSGLLDYFLSEAEDHINTLSRGIVNLETASDNSAAIEELFRAAHTLKGAAALVKLTTTSNIAHKMEDILEELKDKKRAITKDLTEILLYMLDAIKGLIHDISERRAENKEIEQEVLRKTDELLRKKETINLSAEPVEPSTTIAPEKREIRRRKEDFEFFSGNFVKVDVRKVDEMLNLIGEITIKKNYLLQKAKGTGKISDEIFFAGRRLLKEIDTFAERYAYSVPGSVKYTDPLLTDFGELEFDKYDELNLFSRKLQEITNDITEALKELSDFFGSFTDDIKVMNSMIRTLRSDISESRMIEIGHLFQRFVRPVKDMVKQHDKKIDLLISGGDTKIDKVIFERLFDPLIHIVRNAIGHGIEKTDERIKKGKKEEGTITLSARREGNTVIIEITDDGRGIDTDRLFSKAIEKGLLKTAEKPPKEELFPLIFVSGFSTAETTDMVSGRGVGMSAVKRLISALNGVIEVDSDASWGTTFKLRVPSSLAITNVIVFRTGDVEFVMPASVIEEIIQFDLSSQAEEKPDTIDYRGKNIYVKKISDVFNIDSKPEKLMYAIVCNVTDQKAGLIVDAIVGQEEAIIKPLNRFLGGLSVYSGTTISGDGKVRLVLNPTRIFEDKSQMLAFTPKPIISESYEGKRVLVVDDSLSVRKYVSSFLVAKRLHVYSATNGVEALNILDETPVDLIITDLEMPVMHGYELINRIKNSDRFKTIPVIVLTSRSADKHREKALESGAEGYLVKPFDESSISEILRKYLPTADITQ